jgi:hypothetical protein
MTEALEFRECPGPTRGQVWVLAFRQAPRRPDQVRQACLAAFDPGLIHAVAITDQEAGPVVDQRRKGFFGPMGMNHIEGDRITGHDPQPLERVGEKPRGFINVVDQAMPGLGGDGGVVRFNGLGHAVKDFLDRPQADGHPQD